MSYFLKLLKGFNSIFKEGAIKRARLTLRCGNIDISSEDRYSNLRKVRFGPFRALK